MPPLRERGTGVRHDSLPDGRTGSRPGHMIRASVYIIFCSTVFLSEPSRSGGERIGVINRILFEIFPVNFVCFFLKRIVWNVFDLAGFPDTSGISVECSIQRRLFMEKARDDPQPQGTCQLHCTLTTILLLSIFREKEKHIFIVSLSKNEFCRAGTITP